MSKNETEGRLRLRAALNDANLRHLERMYRSLIATRNREHDKADANNRILRSRVAELEALIHRTVDD